MFCIRIFYFERISYDSCGNQVACIGDVYRIFLARVYIIIYIRGCDFSAIRIV
ncbi:Uncharacterised protein [Segatella copri]|nr:Uncharacterised protein [Segatella copri]